MTILPQAFGLFISVLDFYNIPVVAKALGGIVPSIVLGLLLVFRTNTAYERFWEGRKAWGGDLLGPVVSGGGPLDGADGRGNPAVPDRHRFRAAGCVG